MHKPSLNFNIPTMIAGDLINDFVDAGVINALDTMLSSDDVKMVRENAIKVADAFLAGDEWSRHSEQKEYEQHLITGFHKNTALLVQKTWVEKDDFSLKEQVLYKLNRFCDAIKNDNWTSLYPAFREIISDVVYLMFGSQSKSKDFSEYALRIDPEFGIFWWYYENLPETVTWASEKCYYVLLVGMFFLANY